MISSSVSLLVLIACLYCHSQLFDSVLLTQSQGSGGASGKKTEETLLEIASDILSKVRCPLDGICFLYLLDHNFEIKQSLSGKELQDCEENRNIVD